MAESAEAKEKDKKSGGKGGFVIALLLLAVLGAGAGAGFSLTVLNGDKAGAPGKGQGAGKSEVHAAAAAPGKAGKPGEGSGGTKGAEGDGPKDQTVNLDPILVSLAGPQKSWARLELAVVVEVVAKEDQAPLLKSITENFMSFMHTVPLAHVESAAGLEYLREDLVEIARLRSKGRVRTVVLRSLVVE